MNQSLKQAVSSAVQYLQDLYQSQDVPVENILVEEVERSEDGEHWLITLGFNTPSVSPPTNLLGLGAGSPRLERVYKVFEVQADTGEIEAMKIRAVA